MTEDTSFPYLTDPYLTDIVDAIERVRGLLGDMPLETFEADWEKQWAIERSVEIISEASRRLLPEIKGIIYLTPSQDCVKVLPQSRDDV